MSKHLEEIPTIAASGRLGRHAADLDATYRMRAEESGELIGSVTLGMRANIGRLLEGGLTPTALANALRDARVAAVSYSMYTECYNNYNGTCEEACFGFEPHHMDPFYCGTCAEQAADPANNPAYFWHFVGSRGSIQYKDIEPDVCAGRDAWKWDVGACGSCTQHAVYRCHDGLKRYPDANAWDPTICQGLAVCDGQLKTCP
jgi:hypothetical protein